jgi:predicted Zn-dependent protease
MRKGLVVAAVALLAGCVGSGTGLGFDLVSDRQVQELSLESWQRLRSETPVSNEASYRRTAERVTGRLLEALEGDQSDWEVVVFEGDEANAFAMPGGKIGIYEGMFRTARNDAQLAAVIAHEIGHNLAEHAQERLSSQVATSGAVQLVSAALAAGNVGYANAIAGALGLGAQYGVLLPYSRNQELEADRIGVLLMARAGYDPREAVELWRNASLGGAPPSLLSTHPVPAERIQQLEELMPRALALYRR